MLGGVLKVKKTWETVGNKNFDKSSQNQLNTSLRNLLKHSKVLKTIKTNKNNENQLRKVKNTEEQ